MGHGICLRVSRVWWLLCLCAVRCLSPRTYVRGNRINSLSTGKEGVLRSVIYVIRRLNLMSSNRSQWTVV